MVVHFSSYKVTSCDSEHAEYHFLVFIISVKRPKTEFSSVQLNLLSDYNVFTPDS